MSEGNKELSPLKQAFLALEKMQAKVDALEREKHEPLAIIGMGCRFPGGANSPEAFWELLKNGVNAIADVPADRWDIDAFYDSNIDAPGKMSTRWGGFIDKVDQFDPQFFGIAPREATSMDPQQRLLLEVAWEALEYAGQSPEKLYGSKTGVYVGLAASDYEQVEMGANAINSMDTYYLSGIARSIASGRLSYVLGLHGPSVSVDTACSSSLVAVHLACQSLRSRETNMAIAGGVNLILTPENSVALSKYHMMAPDGLCKAFDASADGFVRGEGCGIVVIKRLSDALNDGDRVLAIIRGTAVNQDGPSSGLTAPNGPSQEAVIREALANGNVRPDQIGFVETHGTGTALGDPIEVQALGAVLGKRPSDQAPLMIGSVKTNIGHLESAAGIAGLIKAILTLQQGMIPAHLHLQELTPHIPWDQFSITVPTENTEWSAQDSSRFAGVSSFGFSGTNAHIVLEQAPDVIPAIDAAQRPVHLVALSAKNEPALRDLGARYADYLTANPDLSLADLAFTANTGRSHFSHRLGLITSSVEQAEAQLAAFANGDAANGLISGQPQQSDPPKVAFLFTGQGSQYPGMARKLYDTQPTFRAALDECDRLLQPYLSQSLLDVVFGDDQARLDDTSFTQPALFALEYALATLWMSWGIQPGAVLGHSVGEFVAACIAGVFSLEDGLKLIAARARLMGGLPAGGQMAAILADEATAAAAIAPFGDALSIAALNGPANTVISGSGEAVTAVLNQLKDKSVQTRSLKVSHAFHSPLMQPMLAEFEQVAKQVHYQQPRRKLISNVSGGLAGAEVATAAYWVKHVRAAVQFAAGVQTLAAQGIGIFLEIGPGTTLTGMGQACIEGGVWLSSLRKGRDDWNEVLSSLAILYTQGVTVDWDGFDRDYPHRKIKLPTYPFQRQRYWVKAAKRLNQSTGVHPLLGKKLASPLKDIQFEAHYSIDSVRVLNDHRVYGLAILPATAYIEIAQAAAGQVLGKAPFAIEDMSIHEALIVNDDQERAVQTILKPEAAGQYSFQLFSKGDDEQDWKLHAMGSLHTTQNSAETSETPGAIQARLNQTISADEHYQRFSELGLQFGPSLHGVQQIWRTDGEALGHIRLPDILTGEAKTYKLHPAFLDACLQILSAAMPADADFYMPFSIEHFQMFADTGTEIWSHALVKQGASAETYSADLQLLDGDGQVLAEVSGLHLKRASRNALVRSEQQTWHDWLYEVAWEARKTWSMPTPTTIAAQVIPELDNLKAHYHLTTYQDLSPKIDHLAAGYIQYALQELGWKPPLKNTFTLEQITASLGVLPVYHRLTARFLNMLVEDGLLQRKDAGWTVLQVPPRFTADQLEAQWQALRKAYPTFEAELALTRSCGPYLAGVLNGTVDPLGLLFPGGDLKLAEKLYQESPSALTYNAVVQTAVASIVEQLPSDRSLRILEIGAGTGGTTSFVVPQLPAERVSYTFTDVSPHFTVKAAQKFGAYPFMHYQPLDIERDPIEQGFVAAQADLIIAANVIHATADLRHTLENVRKLLAPGGTLLLLEMIKPERWIDLTFGLTEGWWKFVDADVRPDYLLMPQRGWLDLFADVGFVEGASIPDGNDLPEQAVILGRMPDTSSAQGNWLIFGDQSGVGAHLASLIEAAGGQAVVALPGESYAVNASHVTINPADPEDFRRLLNEKPNWQGVVHLWSLDVTEADDLAALKNMQAFATGSALNLSKALAHRGGSRLWLVTRGVQPTANLATPSVTSQSPLWGLGKVIALEHPELRPVCIDLDANADGATLYAEIGKGDGESQIALHGGERFAARLTRSEIMPTTAQSGTEAVHLDIIERGVLDHLAFLPAERRQPGQGEVEIQVHATGLNFKDVLNALGMYPGNAGLLGSECAGEIVAVGAGVADLAVGDSVVTAVQGSFSTYVIAPAALTVRMPSFLSYEDAAAIPVAFLTAYFCLHHLGHITAGDRVLIHAAAGGVGLAAVQLALAAGAEVFGTAGSPEKHAFLKSVGVQHVMNSRTLDFVDEVSAITKGAGVNVVLNSLADDFVGASLSVLAKNGRFLEIGKRGVLTPQQARELRPDIEYHLIDWGDEAREQPELIRSMFLDIMSSIENGSLQPLPRRVFPSQDVVGAFRYMAQARHIGKIVVSHQSTQAIRGDGTYLITGGLRGLGLLVARWLADKGARHLVLMGRNAPSDDANTLIAELESQGIQVIVVRGDVAEESDVAKALDVVSQNMPPLRGIFHSAGVLDDGMLLSQDWSRFETVMKPKVDGAWNLHHQTVHLALDHFVLFSSIASLFGSPGQSNHAAANAFMDTLAYHRRAAGLAALSINWGAWSTVGSVVDYDVADRLASQGIGLINPTDGLTVLDYLLSQPAAQVGVTPIDWPTFLRQFKGSQNFFSRLTWETRKQAKVTGVAAQTVSQPDVMRRLEEAPPAKRRGLLITHVSEQVGKVIGLDPSQRVGEIVPLNEMGLDSLMAVELRNLLGSGLGLKRPLPATLVFDYPTVAALTDYLANTVLNLNADKQEKNQPVEEQAVAPTATSLNVLDSLEDLSDEEIDRLFMEQLGQTQDDE